MTDMAFKPEDFAGRSRSPEWERDLADWLRTLPEGDRLNFIVALVDYQFVVALQLAHKCLAERSSFLTLMELGLKSANPYSIKFWLECVVPRLGFRRSVKSLHNFLDSNPQGVAKALYYFLRLPEARKPSPELNDLLQEARSRGIQFEPPSEDGV